MHFEYRHLWVDAKIEAALFRARCKVSDVPWAGVQHHLVTSELEFHLL